MKIRNSKKQLAADYRNAEDYAERKVKGDTNA